MGSLSAAALSVKLSSFSKERQRVDLPTCLTPKSNTAGDIDKTTFNIFSADLLYVLYLNSVFYIIIYILQK